MSIFRLFELLVFILEMRFFALEYRQRHFTGLYFVKKMLEKQPFLDQNHGLTRLEKCQIFEFLIILFSQLRKAFFRSTISSKRFSWTILPKKKSWKLPFLDQNHGLTPLEKCQFFEFFIILFSQLIKTFFRSTISSKRFSWTILPKKKNFETWPFLDQNNALTPLKKCQFFNCLNFLFLQLKKGVSSL